MTKHLNPNLPSAGFMLKPQAWTKRSACKPEDGPLFFSSKLDDVNAAKALCRSCPVRKTCLDEALVEEGNAPHGRYGIRGGKTAEQRATLHRTNKQSRGDSRD